MLQFHLVYKKQPTIWCRWHRWKRCIFNIHWMCVSVTLTQWYIIKFSANSDKVFCKCTCIETFVNCISQSCCFKKKSISYFLVWDWDLGARLRSWELPQAIQRPYSSSPLHLSQVVSMNQNSPQVVFVIYSSSSIP